MKSITIKYEDNEQSIERTISYPDTAEGLENELSEETLQGIRKEDYISALEADHIQLMLENKELKDDRDYFKEKLIEDDIELGDMYYASDRGNDMKHD